MTLPKVGETQISIDIKRIIKDLSQDLNYSNLQIREIVHYAITSLLDRIDEISFVLEECRDDQRENGVLLSTQFEGTTDNGILVQYAAVTDYFGHKGIREAYFTNMCVNMKSEITPLRLAVDLSDVVRNAFYEIVNSRQLTHK